MMLSVVAVLHWDIWLLLMMLVIAVSQCRPSLGHFNLKICSMTNLPSNLFDIVFTLDFMNVYASMNDDDFMNLFIFNLFMQLGAEPSADEFRSSPVRGPASSGQGESLGVRELGRGRGLVRYDGAIYWR